MRFSTPLETPGANWAAATSLTLVAQQVAGKAARDALFLTSYPVSTLPLMMAAGAVLSLAAVFWLSRLMSRHSPATLMPILFAISAAAFVAEWFVGLRLPEVAAVMVYLHTALFGPTLLTTFWSLINERFDPHSAKRAVARIAGGATAGGVVGGLLVWRASTVVAVSTVLLFLAALNAIGLVGSLIIRASRDRLAAAADGELEIVSPLGELRRAPYLRNLALLVAVCSMTATLLDYVFSAHATATIAKGAPLLSFFALFWLAVSVLAFVLQIGLGRYALERLGLAVSIAVLPGIIILGGAFGLAVPGLLSTALLRGLEAVQRNTLFRTAYELLYTPLSNQRKRATKAIIDVGFDRLGTILGSVVTIAALAVFPLTASSILLGAVVMLALATLPLARQLHLGYVDALEESLRDGAQKPELGASSPWQANAPPTVEASGRDQIIERVEELHPGGLTALLEGPDGEIDSAPAQEALDDPRRALANAVALLSGDEPRMRRALTALAGKGPAATCAIFVLAHPTLHLEALAALRRIAPAITGQLVDALLDGDIDFVVRRRIPRVLSACISQRATDGLMLGIADERFEVRYQCGRALLRITSADATIVISRDKVIESIVREIELGEPARKSVRAEDLDDELQPSEPSTLTELLVRDRIDRSLEHVFTILSLHLEREPLRTAFAALHEDDVRQRGTALEYLDTVLPAEVRAAIWPYLGESQPLPTARTAQEILSDLAMAVRDR